MRIAWIKTDYLHPTTRGGQIRSLEMLKRLARHHEVTYLTMDMGGPESEEGARRAGEYSHRHEAVAHKVVSKRSPQFWLNLGMSLFNPLPLAVSRWANPEIERRLRELDSENRFDVIVCDFLAPAASLPAFHDEDWKRVVLFQHNIEAQIWQRHAEHGATILHRWYFNQQARKMAAFERKISQVVRKVVTVSQEDARQTESDYGVTGVEWVPTGVDVDYFAPTASPAPGDELVFLGSMDWLPNIDGARWLEREILPRIWQQRPQTRIALVGRKPIAELVEMAKRDSRVRVTGTVDDVRPWLHAGKVSVVPLRIGGGTRLKIYESMAAGVSVVSTTIGAEGLDVRNEDHLILADTTESFAAACLKLLEQEEERKQMTARAFAHVRKYYTWESIAERFASYLVKE